MGVIPPQSSRARPPLALVVGRRRREVSDAELSQGLVGGEEWAVNEAWHRFAPLVLRTTERTLGSRSEAEDLTQEVFVSLCQRAATLRDPSSLRSFVYSIAVRQLRSALRQRRLRSWLSLLAPEALPDLPHATPDVEGRELLRQFYVLLDRLSARERLVFVLRRIETMTVEEIAVVMSISPSTVKRSLARATERLSRWVEGDAHLSGLLALRRGERTE